MVIANLGLNEFEYGVFDGLFVEVKKMLHYRITNVYNSEWIIDKKSIYWEYNRLELEVLHICVECIKNGVFPDTCKALVEHKILMLSKKHQN